MLGGLGLHPVVPAAQHKAILLCAWTAFTKSSGVYMIYLQNDTPASPELASALLRHADPGTDAAVVSPQDGITQFGGNGVFVCHVI